MSNNLTKNSIRYTFATIFSQTIGLFRGLLIPIIFNAFELGAWNLSNIIINYGNNSHLGTLHGMNKFIPYLKGKNQENSIQNTISLRLEWKTNTYKITRKILLMLDLHKHTNLLYKNTIPLSLKALKE